MRRLALTSMALGALALVAVPTASEAQFKGFGGRVGHVPMGGGGGYGRAMVGGYGHQMGHYGGNWAYNRGWGYGGGWGHRHHRGFGFGTGLLAGAALTGFATAPYWGDYGYYGIGYDDCAPVRVVRWTPWGYRVRWVSSCYY